MFILPHGTWKDNIKSVILDWRQKSVGRSSEGDRSSSLSNKGRDVRVTQSNMSCVFSGRRTTSQIGSPPQKKWVKSFWVYSYCTQSSPSKNKNINYIFIYLRFFGCLSSGAICDSSNEDDVDASIQWLEPCWEKREENTK